MAQPYFMFEMLVSLCVIGDVHRNQATNLQLKALMMYNTRKKTKSKEKGEML